MSAATTMPTVLLSRFFLSSASDGKAAAGDASAAGAPVAGAAGALVAGVSGVEDVAFVVMLEARLLR
ncbi:hypothetical protein AEAC466_21445 [Asticcacaulis sp. AC466]|uniref:hypothetical protein n=1 Tax=Asticcacaulis sp. AC466 TaxID=1282362 RepID=UPI0003C3FE0D|nr:hypothetical protein [Asticcacaulis sp. AC466]ESQ81433.1 hypothetical protein AEAC466_21445 [Asticcacaulis sp. AC466]